MTSDGPSQELREQSHTSSCRGEARPVSVRRFQEGAPGTVGGAVGGGAGHLTRTETAHCFVGGVY